MPLGLGRGQNVGLRNFCHILTLLPPGASVFHKHMSRFKTCIDNQYALNWTPNAYRNMLMSIFTPSLYFQCVFNDFQCVITPLRALSVALLRLSF